MEMGLQLIGNDESSGEPLKLHWHTFFYFQTLWLMFFPTHYTDPLRISVFITDPHHACKIPDTECIMQECQNYGGNGPTKSKIGEF